jgi:hypothetical protein
VSHGSLALHADSERKISILAPYLNAVWMTALPPGRLPISRIDFRIRRIGRWMRKELPMAESGHDSAASEGEDAFQSDALEAVARSQRRGR